MTSVTSGTSDIVQDTITLQSIDNEGKHYDDLTRAYFAGAKTGKSNAPQSSYVIDINTNLYSLEVFCKYQLLISKSDECKTDYEYVMNGYVYKVTDQKTKTKNSTEFYVSFGGLLLKATVSSFLAPIMLDDNLFLMIRKL